MGIYKARLVVKGYLQTSGIDYGETYSPVIKLASVRVVLTIIATQEQSIKQLDVSNTFLHGTLHNDVYISQPQVYVDPH